jgi:alpha-galactosidase
MTRQTRYLRLATFFTLIVVVLLVQAGVKSIPPAEALENGVARTPPMGWNSWNKFGCNVTDSLARGIADAMVSSGMAAAGYQFVNLDDCWQGSGRTNGHVQLDSDFPNMKALADYIHSKGLKMGVYSDRGTATCAGRVGSHTYETTDANDYAAWGVDYLKYDNCNADSDIQADYQRMGNALLASGRSIVYSLCAWQYYSWEPAMGNLWRTTGDISDNWSSMIGKYDANVGLYANAKPGAWNDPDMLEIGNGGMTDTEYRTHMSLWAIMAAPLIAGNDIRSMTQATKDILTAPEIIAVDQDSLGKQGVKVRDDGNSEVISKEMSGTNVRAVALLNRGSSAANITVNWSEIGLPSGNAAVRDLWARVDRGTFNNSYTVSVPSHGTALLKIVSGGTNPTNTPTPTTGPTPTPTPTPTPGGGGSYEAEAGTRAGAAVLQTCSACSGGRKVGYIGNGSANYVTLTVNVSASGSRTMTIWYTLSGSRSFYVSVNGGAGVQKSLSGSSWSTPVSATMNVTLNAGNNTIKFYNNSAYAPDLDRIVVP